MCILWKHCELFKKLLILVDSIAIIVELILSESDMELHYNSAKGLLNRTEEVCIRAFSLSLPAVFTSPKAPRPMTLMGSKSSTPNLDLFKRRNSVSLTACWARFSDFCSSGSSLRDSSSRWSLSVRKQEWNKNYISRTAWQNLTRAFFCKVRILTSVFVPNVVRSGYCSSSRGSLWPWWPCPTCENWIGGCRRPPPCNSRFGRRRAHLQKTKNKE